MDERLINLYCPGMTEEQLAAKILFQTFGDATPTIPIDPFKLMRDYGIIYQFMEFKDLEGIYLVPETKEDVPMVGINYKRRVTRQRFTAAHELCHHIKDRRNEACPISGKGNIEKYAENFAAELLMPTEIFLTVARRYSYNGKVSLDDALLIAEQFGVSFRSCVLRLAYRFHMLEGGTVDLNKRISKYKPDAQKQRRGIDIEDINLLRQTIDSYTFFFSIEGSLVWYKFKTDFIYNENRMEGLNLDEEEVAEIVTDLRLNGKNSAYCTEQYEEIIQVAGHSEIYDYIFRTKENLNIYKILDLNRMLFQYAPFPDEAGKTRTNNNLVLGTKFETVDYHDVARELIKLQKPVDDLILNAAEMTISEYLLEAVKIHHRITQIHPFRDGNGRCSRALLNWMLRIKGLPPIYIRNNDKEKYYKALASADCSSDFTELLRIIIKELYRTILNVQSERTGI